MKYYAVTDDPNELLHYGVKGMKWGKHLFGNNSRPKSRAFKRAANKLKAFKNSATTTAKSVKSAVKKSSIQIASDYQKKQQERYNKSIQRLQSNTSLINRIKDINRDRQYYKQIKKDIKNERNAAINLAKIENYQKAAQANALATQARQMKKAVKVDKNFDKILQKAREGRLRYGDLNEDQIRRVQDRLTSEDMARRLGGKEKPAWRLQKKEARRAGRLKGIEQGTAAAMTEVAKAGAQYGIQHILDRRKLNAAAKYEGKRNRVKARQQNKRSHKDIAREIREEAFEERVRSGEGIIARNNPFVIKEGRKIPIGLSGKIGTKGAAKYLKAKNEEKERKAAEQRAIDDEATFNRDIYRKVILGNKNDSANDIIKRLEQREEYRNQIYKIAPPPSRYDQPKPESESKRRREKTINDSRPKMNKYYNIQPGSKTIKLNAEQVVGHITGKRRKRKDNPLKG